MKNEKIITALKSKELGPKTFAFMTHQEMNPEHWKHLLEKKRMIDKSKYNTDLVANTDMFTCSKCKSKKCNYYTLQTRSADEPETIFITCLDCGKNWKR
jgi:DNA-directed RNA polymerase, subunit M/Transcription elongation factor TFIIS